MQLPGRRSCFVILVIVSLVLMATLSTLQGYWEDIVVLVAPDAAAGCLEGIVTVLAGGRLGNLAFEYAAAWAVARNLGFRFAVPRDILNPLSEVFSNLSAEALEPLFHKYPACEGLSEKRIIGKDYWPTSSMPVEVIAKWASENRRPLVLSKYMVMPTFVAAARNDLRQEFSFRPEVQHEAITKLENITNNVAKQASCIKTEVCTVGVHVRRTDYGAHLKYYNNVETEAGVSYYRDAAATLQRRLRAKCAAFAFVVTSDDDEWCKQHLLPAMQLNFTRSLPPSYIFLKSSENRIVDLCLLASCHHMIHSYGTFGMLAGVINRGTVVVYDVLRHGAKLPNDNVKLATLLPDWIALP